MKLGAHVLGLSAILLGAVGLRWDDFAAVWQPVPADVLGRAALAYLAAFIFLAVGLALQSRRTARIGAPVLAVLFAVFALLWLPRVVARPLIFATWGGVAEQLACALGAMATYAWAAPAESQHKARLTSALRVGFGVCAIAFGFNHFFALKETAAMTPHWLPPGAIAWAAATGVFHVLGGLALVSGVQALLGARLLTLMYAGFGVLVWAPILWKSPGDHTAWCGNAVNLTLVGSSWMLADLLATRNTLQAAASVQSSDTSGLSVGAGLSKARDGRFSADKHTTQPKRAEMSCETCGTTYMFKVEDIPEAGTTPETCLVPGCSGVVTPFKGRRERHRSCGTAAGSRSA